MPRDRVIGAPADMSAKDTRLCTVNGCYDLAPYSRSTLGGGWVCLKHFGLGGNRDGGGSNEPRRLADFLPATDAAEP